MISIIFNFCLMHPNAHLLKQSVYEAKVKRCRAYMTYCVGADPRKMGECQDSYNKAVYPERECRNDLNGKCD